MVLPRRATQQSTSWYLKVKGIWNRERSKTSCSVYLLQPFVPHVELNILVFVSFVNYYFDCLKYSVQEKLEPDNQWFFPLGWWLSQVPNFRPNIHI